MTLEKMKEIHVGKIDAEIIHLKNVGRTMSQRTEVVTR